MRPKYFALIIYTAYKAARRAVVEQCSDFVSSGHSLIHDLALCSVQNYGLVKSASISPSKPVPSLAAGLPHFAAGWARCWGRDVVSVCSIPMYTSRDESGIGTGRWRMVADAVVYLASRSVLDYWQLQGSPRPYSSVRLHPETRFDPQLARLD